MDAAVQPIVVDFPLRGEWVAANTPGHRVPSHGTDMLGQRFAYDFLRIEPECKGFKFFRGSYLRYFLRGVPLAECHGYGAPIHAPFPGTVMVSQDGWPEREPVHFLRDLAVVVLNALTFNPKKSGDWRSVLGNHVILKMAEREVYAFFAHARCGSVRVREGDVVQTGQHMADVGHSGNSTAPHLHFHLMDRADIRNANGLPCCFARYEAFDGSWRTVNRGVPERRRLIRNAG